MSIATLRRVALRMAMLDLELRIRKNPALRMQLESELAQFQADYVRLVRPMR